MRTASQSLSLRNALLAAALLLALGPGRALAQASCTVASLARLESALNTSDGEDEDFLGAKVRALPQIAWVLDTSGVMRRFPVDLLDPETRAAGVGLAPNTLLDALVYAANPCEDARGQALNPTPNTCQNGPPRIPDGFGMRYNRDANANAQPRTYAAYESRLGGALFNPAMFYVHDRGWGQDSYSVCTSCTNPTGTAGGWVFATSVAACANAYPIAPQPFAGPTGAIEQAQCVTALGDPLRGYYLPSDPKNGPPVLKGNWMNFFPPKYVIARRTMVEQFEALTSPVRIRQMMATTEDEAAEHCYSSRLGNAGIDPLRDGARRIHSSTDFKPPCANVGCTGGSGGGVPAFGNAVYNNNPQLFTSPTVAPVVAVPPSNTPAGYTLTFAPRSDGLFDGEFVNNLDPTDRQDAFCAPYAEMLLNVGTYMGEYSVFDNDFIFQDGTYPAGRWGKGGWVGPEICPAATCSCSRPTMILLAGGDPGFDDNLPCEITGQECAALPLVTGSGSGACGSLVGIDGNLARMARYLAVKHLRPSGGFPAGVQVGVNTFVIGFGTDSPALVGAATAGGGSFILADDAQSLKGAINETLKRITTAELSFSNANISAVQTRTTSALIVPRFTPSKSSFWKGKLSRYQLVSEYGCGCTLGGPPITGCPTNATADYNGDGKCDGVFFMDRDGSWIAAATDGAFRKVAAAGATATLTGVPAVPIWDASDRLDCPVGTNLCSGATGAARSRKILTVTDSNADGLFDYRDQVISFDTTPANRDLILPYLNLDNTFCAQLSAKVGQCLDQTTCANKVIDYVRGLDVFDENCDGNNTDERPNKLGDIFHSSPVLVDPPLPSKSQLCRLGLHNQCIISLFGTPTLMDPASKYDDYVNLAANKNRDKVILVGANDGMLHAFNAGVYDGATKTYSPGTGDELWAFIPPDMLPKLSRLVDGSKHQFYVDGTPMVRDIWADSIPRNHTKSADEFHTVAVVGERRGGSSFFALDVTSPNGPSSLPSTGFFRWIYPQPNTVPARVSGNSYADFLPTPPPIGPVRIKDTSSSIVDPNFSVPYEERWIVLLNGGYDSQGTRGRLLSMVDAWYGGKGGDPTERKDLPIWAFVPGTGPVNFTNKADFNKPGYPFAATPGMVAFGPTSTNVNQSANQYFFDTATLGDTGGQLWSFRFNHPDPAKWSGGRVFASATAGSTCARQPFYQVTANVIAAQGGHLRTLVGTGDRFNLNDTFGGECSASNLIACVRRGCKLRTKVTTKICDKDNTYQRDINPSSISSCSETNNLDVEVNVGTACCTKNVEAKADYELECTNSDGSTVKVKWNPEFKCEPKTTTVCGSPFTQYSCKAKKDVPFDVCQTFDRCDDNTIEATVPRNSFYSVKVFDTPAGRQAFNDTAGANAYDGAMLTTAGLRPNPSGVDPYTPTAAASVVSDYGWYLNYGGPVGRPLCSVAPTNTLCIPTDPSTSLAFPYQAGNERTASQAAVAGGCAFWSTYTPADQVSTCGNSATGLHTTYSLNMYTGNVCTGLDPSLLTTRGSSALDSLPPAPPTLTVFLPPNDGPPQITITTVPRGAGSSAPTRPVASRTSLKSEAYTLDVPRGLHACRHPNPLLPIGANSTDGAGVSQRGDAALQCQ